MVYLKIILEKCEWCVKSLEIKFQEKIKILGHIARPTDRRTTTTTTAIEKRHQKWNVCPLELLFSNVYFYWYNDTLMLFNFEK